MGKIFTLTDDIKQIAAAAVDDLIDQLGKTCRLVFPSTRHECPNCFYAPHAGRSSGRYRPGGASPFAVGTTCPVCLGEGLITDAAVTEDIIMLCSWTPKEWWLPPSPGVVVPDGAVQTKTYLSHLPSILKSRVMQLQVGIEGHLRLRYELAGEPGDPGNIVQGRYVVCTWHRKG